MVKGGKFTVGLVQIDIISQIYNFSTYIEFLARNTEKFFKFGKIRKSLKIGLRKKRFQPSKKHLCKNWRAENMPVVTGQVVTVFVFSCAKESRCRVIANA